MPTTCKFEFNRATATYYSGEQISGNIVLTTTKEMTLEAILINCKGGAKINWYTFASKTPTILHNDSSDDDDSHVHFHGQEVYMNESIRANNCLVLHAGTHHYKFAFNLPAQCPATCSQKYGKISYSVTLVLDRRSTFDKTFEHRVVVKNRLDLNEEKHKYLHCCRSISNEMCFSIPHTGYVPGQVIDFHLEMPTNDAANKVHVRLCQKYIFKSQYPAMQRKEVIWILSTAKFENIGSMENVVGCLRIPLLSPMSSMAPAAILEVCYYLEAIIFGRRNKVLSKLTMPITLGTKPLQAICMASTESIAFCYDNYKDKDAAISKIYNEQLSLSTSTLDHNSCYVKNRFSDRSSLLVRKLVKSTSYCLNHLPDNCMQLFFFI